MSRELNVYSTNPEWLAPEAFVDALRAYGLEAEWISDDSWSPGEEIPWHSGRLKAPDGDTLYLSEMTLEDEEKEAVKEQAEALGPAAEATVANLKTVYRLQGDGPLLAAALQAAAKTGPSVILDPGADQVWHRPDPNAPWEA
jgi:hypothetical protein